MGKMDEHGGLSHGTICKISVEYGEHGGYNWIIYIGFNHPKNGGVGCFDWGTHHWQNGSKMNNTYIFVIFVCIGWWLGWYSDIWLTYKYGWHSDWYVYNIILYMPVCYHIILYIY